MELSNGLFVLDLQTLKWRKVFQKATPQPRESPVLVANQKSKKIYMFGGKNKDCVFNLHRLNFLDLKGVINKIKTGSDQTGEIEIGVTWEENTFSVV